MSDLPLALIGYRGPYKPRVPVLFYPREDETEGPKAIRKCRGCVRSFRSFEPALCCSRDCALKMKTGDAEIERTFHWQDGRRGPKKRKALEPMQATSGMRRILDENGFEEWAVG